MAKQEPTDYSPTHEAFEAYQSVAETVGGPSLRWKDNVIQAAIVIVLTIIGAAVGLIGWALKGALIGGAGTMILSTLVSGFVLMILGAVRAKRNVDRLSK